MKDVHTEHCCVIHGCKYCDPDSNCSVTSRRKRQSYLCERCIIAMNDFWNLEGEYREVMVLKKLVEYIAKGSPHA